LPPNRVKSRRSLAASDLIGKAGDMLGEHIYMEVMWGLIAVATASKPPHRRDTNGEEVAIPLCRSSKPGAFQFSSEPSCDLRTGVIAQVSAAEVS